MVSKLGEGISPTKSLDADETPRRRSSRQLSNRTRKISEKSASIQDTKSSPVRSRRNSNVSVDSLIHFTIEDTNQSIETETETRSVRKKRNSKTRTLSEKSNESFVGVQAPGQQDQNDTTLQSLDNLTIDISDDESNHSAIRRNKSLKSGRKSDSNIPITARQSFSEIIMEIDSSVEETSSIEEIPPPREKSPKTRKSSPVKPPSSLDSPGKAVKDKTPKSKKKKSRQSEGRPEVSGILPRENEVDDVQNSRNAKQHENGSEEKENPSKNSDSEVTVRRRGGGTIIESRPVFSDDAKYVYVNCGWGVRVFSVETGECVRVFDAYSKDHKVVTCFCWKSLPAALTSEGVFMAWDPRSGKVRQKVRLHIRKSELAIDGFFVPAPDGTIFCVVVESKRTTYLRVYSESNFRSLAHPLSSRTLGYPYNLHHISVGGDPTKPFLAFINGDKKLNIINMNNKHILKNGQAGNGKHWTCVRCHPTEDAVAVGDSIGRIVVYRNVRSGKPSHPTLIPSIYHWHTLPVSEIAFTPAGSSMYSGGGELTLVKWNVENPHIRNYLPRLSADIVHIAISPYNQTVAVATLDNGVQIVTPNNKLQCILQQLSWSVFSGEHEGMFPAGLLYDPRSRGLILNGRPGHLQIYSPLSETLTYNIDVTMMNYLTQERDKVIVNTHVTHSALTSDGLWLATIETRYEPGLALELRLKFWAFELKKKKFLLATVIDMPHDGKVHTIKFSPGPTGNLSNDRVNQDQEIVLVSTGADKKMRLWSKTSFTSASRKCNSWRCQNACFYKDRPCGPCSFSSDGSILAVGFGSALTLWDVDNVEFKHSLTRGPEDAKYVEFGRDTCCNILLSASEKSVVAWNLLTLTLAWEIDMKTAMFIADPYSSYVAIFTTDNQWKIIDSLDGHVVYTMNNEGKSEVTDGPGKPQVLAAVFAPRHRPNPEAPQWLRNSYLYYIDIYQELNCLEPANEIAQLPTFQLALDKDVGTLFGSLVNAKSVQETDGEELTKTSVGYGVLGSQAVTQLLRPAAHTLPPVSLLCSSLLQSFIILKRDRPDESDREDKSEDDKTTIVASSDSENDVEMPTFPGESLRKKKSSKSFSKTHTPQSTSLSEKSPEKMETDGPVDLSKHFPLLNEDDHVPDAAVFIIDE